MNDMTCQELVDSVTSYLDGALDLEDERRLAKHIAECFGCESYIDQFRCVVESLGELPVRDVSDDLRKACMDAFRDCVRLRDPLEAARVV